MTYSDYPKKASQNARKALKYLEESGNPRNCLTKVGFARARQLAGGEALSADVVKRMAQFNRHRQNKDVPYDEGCGGIAWDAWGGTEGVDWAIRKSKQIDQEKSMDIYKAKPDELKVGDFVSWNSSGGTARGKIVEVHRSGKVDVPDSSFTLNASEEDPVALIRIYRNDDPTDRIVGHKFSTLRKIQDIKGMNLPYVLKNTGTSIKEVDIERRLVEGYFSIFDFKDSDGDILLKGAFKKTIEENGTSGKNRIMHLYQHDPLMVLGKPMTLMEDDKGLYFKTMITDTELGTDVLKLYRDGVLKEHSVGINFVQREYSNNDDAYIVKECKMWEGSTVTWGANEMALGGMAKGSHSDAVDQYKRLSKAWYEGDYTDDTFMLIEKQIKHLEDTFRKSLQGTKPIQDTITLEREADSIKKMFDQFNNQLSIQKSFEKWT